MKKRRWIVLMASTAVVLAAVASGLTLANARTSEADRAIDAESQAVLPAEFGAAIEKGALGPKGATSTHLIGRRTAADDVPWNLVATEGDNGDTMLTLTSDPGQDSGLFAPFDGYCRKSSRPLTLCGVAAAGTGLSTTRVLVLGAKGAGVDRVETTVGDVFDAGRFFAVIVLGEEHPIALSGFSSRGQRLSTLQVPPVPDDMPVVNPYQE